MIHIDEASEYQKCIYPWIFDRIEVTGARFTGPRSGTHLTADFERPTEPVAFCLLGTYCCEFQGGPHLAALSAAAAEIVGGGGFYGMKGGRRLTR